MFFYEVCKCEHGTFLPLYTLNLIFAPVHALLQNVSPQRDLVGIYPIRHNATFDLEVNSSDLKNVNFLETISEIFHVATLHNYP